MSGMNEPPFLPSTVFTRIGMFISKIYCLRAQPFKNMYTYDSDAYTGPGGGRNVKSLSVTDSV